jgi:hypothetical protein
MMNGKLLGNLFESIFYMLKIPYFCLRKSRGECTRVLESLSSETQFEIGHLPELSKRKAIGYNDIVSLSNLILSFL